MKQIVSCVIIIVLGLSLTACFNGSGALVEPLYNESKTVIAGDGSEFTVIHHESGFPEIDIVMYINFNGKDIFSGVVGYKDEYDYKNDFVENYAEIIDEYHNEDFSAYQFNWCIIYSFDEGETFSGVLKENYTKVYSEDGKFKTVYTVLNCQ